jgi:hypothetical protein
MAYIFEADMVKKTREIGLNYMYFWYYMAFKIIQSLLFEETHFFPAASTCALNVFMAASQVYFGVAFGVWFP